MEEQNKTKKFDWNPNQVAPFLEISETSCMFAKHRTNYIKSVESFIAKALKDKTLDFEITDNLMTIRTTMLTRDPYIFIKGEEMLNLISRGYDLEMASLVLQNEVYSEIINVYNLCATKTFENRRHRLQNPKVIKALELITKTKILVIRKVVAVIGNYKGIEIVKDVVFDCFEKNIHPAYKIRELVVKKNLLKENRDGDWTRFVPVIKKSNSPSAPKKNSD